VYTTRIFWNENLSEAEGQQKLKDLWAKAPEVVSGQGRIGSKEGPYPDWLTKILSRHFQYDHVNYSYFVTTGQQPWWHYRFANWLILFLHEKGVWSRFRFWIKLAFGGFPLYAVRMLPAVFRLPPGHADAAAHLRVIIFEDLDAIEMDSMDWTR
jgi:hypothetical protein